MRLKYKVEDLKGILLVFFILYATDSALVNTNVNRIWARISWILILLLFAWLLDRKPCWRVRGVLPVVLLCGCFFMTMVFKAGGNYVNYLQRIVLLLTCFMLSEYMPYRDFMRYFIQVMRVIALVSIAGCLCREWILEYMPFLPLIHYSDTYYVKSLLFTNVSATSPRNFGPFWEPGAYQLYLNWVIFYEIRCFVEGEHHSLRESHTMVFPRTGRQCPAGVGGSGISAGGRRSRDGFYMSDILLFSAAVLTTRSTAGMLILALEFAYFGLHMKWTDVVRRRLPEYKLFILAAGVLGIILVFSTGLYEFAFAKLQAFLKDPEVLNSATVSAYTRFHGIGANISIMRENPLFGVGIQGVKEYLFESFSLTSNTNSILGMGAAFGIPAMILYMGMMVRCVRNGSSGRVMGFVFLLILVAMYSTESLLVSFFFTLVLFFEGRTDRGEKNSMSV